jgi:hypothetical protein
VLGNHGGIAHINKAQMVAEQYLAEELLEKVENGRGKRAFS